MIYESVRKMTHKEQEAYDLGYLNGESAAIRSQWVKTADRLPQDDELPEEDNGMVMCAFLVTGVTAKPFYVFELTRANAIRSYPERTAYWMQIPKLPEVEE